MKNPKETNTTGQVGSLKRKVSCKGGNQHDYVLVLPSYGVRTLDGEHATKTQIEAYYKSKDRELAFQIKEDEYLRSVGIEDGGWKPMMNTRYYMCSRCYKKHYERG